MVQAEYLLARVVLERVQSATRHVAFLLVLSFSDCAYTLPARLDRALAFSSAIHQCDFTIHNITVAKITILGVARDAIIIM